METLEMVAFTSDDICDVKCPAQALALAKMEGVGELMFCWHHKEEHGEALLDQGWEIVEDYETYASYSVAGRYL